MKLAEVLQEKMLILQSTQKISYLHKKWLRAQILKQSRKKGRQHVININIVKYETNILYFLITVENMI